MLLWKVVLGMVGIVFLPSYLWILYFQILLYCRVMVCVSKCLWKHICFEEASVLNYPSQLFIFSTSEGLDKKGGFKLGQICM